MTHFLSPERSRERERSRDRRLSRERRRDRDRERDRDLRRSFSLSFACSSCGMKFALANVLYMVLIPDGAITAHSSNHHLKTFEEGSLWTRCNGG